MFNGKIASGTAPPKSYRSRPCALCEMRGVTILIGGKQRATPATRILHDGEGRCEQHYLQYGTKPRQDVFDEPRREASGNL